MPVDTYERALTIRAPQLAHAGGHMTDERVQRRLAAILSADVVGYSRLMRVDEEGTFERIRAHRKELFEQRLRDITAAYSN